MLGVSFALTPAQVAALAACGDDCEEWLEELEESDTPAFQHDKAWDALHRCLGDGELVMQDGPPRAHAVFGPEFILDEPFTTLLPADAVPAVADAIDAVDRDWLRARYEALGATNDDFDYTWDNLAELRPFLRRAADSGAAILFNCS